MVDENNWNDAGTRVNGMYKKVIELNNRKERSSTMDTSKLIVDLNYYEEDPRRFVNMLMEQNQHLE